MRSWRIVHAHSYLFDEVKAARVQTRQSVVQHIKLFIHACNEGYYLDKIMRRVKFESVKWTPLLSVLNAKQLGPLGNVGRYSPGLGCASKRAA